MLIFRGNYVLTFRYRLPAVVKAVLSWLNSEIYAGSLLDVFLSCQASYELFSVDGYRIILTLSYLKYIHAGYYPCLSGHGVGENGNIPSFAFHNTHTVISENVFYFFETLSLGLCHFLPLGGRVF